MWTPTSKLPASAQERLSGLSQGPRGPSQESLLSTHVTARGHRLDPHFCRALHLTQVLELSSSHVNKDGSLSTNKDGSHFHQLPLNCRGLLVFEQTSVDLGKKTWLQLDAEQTLSGHWK